MSQFSRLGSIHPLSHRFLRERILPSSLPFLSIVGSSAREDTHDSSHGIRHVHGRDHRLLAVRRADQLGLGDERTILRRLAECLLRLWIVGHPVVPVLGTVCV